MEEVNNIVGTDISIDVCINDGYMMVDTEGHCNVNITHQYKVFCYWPRYVEPHAQVASSDYISWKELLELYNRKKEGIDSYADDMAVLTNSNQPTFYQFVSVAQTINQYCGLN